MQQVIIGSQVEVHVWGYCFPRAVCGLFSMMLTRLPFLSMLPLEIVVLVNLVLMDMAVLWLYLLHMQAVLMYWLYMAV